ncbi:hypothetical protein ACWZHB_01165 [Nocardia sp. FBN12]|uniref:hypothetical protein n=1 Tax=Nocardia sp. FBN12 TaxID=3419766 RepID=UPI003CFF021D
MSKMSLDEYMELLAARSAEWQAANPPREGVKPKPWVEPLLTWFIRDGDEELVELPETTPRPKPKPRYYRPASYWRERCEALSKQMEALAEPIITDRAAAGGVALGPRRTARVQAREDSRLQRYTALKPKLDHAKSMLRAAEAREAKQASA